jgi:hypothetical protein
VSHVPPWLEEQQPPVHPAQVAPPPPHEAVDCPEYASQVPVAPPLQQPFGHVLSSHAHVPFVVSQSPLGQLPQLAPLAPHWVGVWEAYATHVLPLQQPPGQRAASQTHVPVVVLQSRPVPQAAHCSPPVPHPV